MQGQESFTSLFFVVTKNIMIGYLILLVDWYECTVYVWIFLVQMYDESYDVFFAETSGDVIVHILCPFLYFRVSDDMSVIGTFGKVYLLVPEREFVHLIA